MAIAVAPGPDRDQRVERRLTIGAAIALGIVIGLFVYAMVDAYLL
jgi:hypothetical protein